jgi:hypothetical protein
MESNQAAPPRRAPPQRPESRTGPTRKPPACGRTECAMLLVVGAGRFELPTSRTRTVRATKLRYAPSMLEGAGQCDRMGALSSATRGPGTDFGSAEVFKGRSSRADAFAKACSVGRLTGLYRPRDPLRRQCGCPARVGFSRPDRNLAGMQPARKAASSPCGGAGVPESVG